MHDTHFARCQPAVSQPACSAYPLPSPHPCLGSHLRLLLWSSTVCMLPAGRLCRLHPPQKKTLKEPCGRIRAVFITERGGFSHPPQRCGCRRPAPGSAAEPQRERCGALRTTSGPVQPITSQFSPAQLGPAPGRCRASPPLPRGAAAVAARSEAAGTAASTMNQTATVSHQGQCQSSRAAKVGPAPGHGRLGGSRGGGRGERGESFRFPRPLGGCPKFARRSCRGASGGTGMGSWGHRGQGCRLPCPLPLPCSPDRSGAASSPRCGAIS